MKQKYIVTLKLLEDKNSFLYQYDLVAEETEIAKIFYCYLSEVEFNNIKNDKRIELIHQYQEFKYRVIPTPIHDEEISIQTYTHSSDGRFRNLARITQSPDALGKNVDIIIVDAYMPSNAPELLDSNGNQRFIQYNWNDLYLDVLFGAITVRAYPYVSNKPIYLTPSIQSNLLQQLYVLETNEWSSFSNYTLSDASLRPNGRTKYNYELSKDLYGAQHGVEVASVAAGNTNGWASESNIYFMRLPIPGDPDITDYPDYWIQYIRAFHRRKKFIALKQGTKANPTIVNCSWGTPEIGTTYDGYNSSTAAETNISSVKYRGQNFTPQASCAPAPFTINPPTCVTYDKLTEWGFRTINIDNNRLLLGVFEDGNSLDPALNGTSMSWLSNLISEGVTVVVAAGNSSSTIDSIRLSTTDGDYYNTVTMTQPNSSPSLTLTDLYTHRGFFPQLQDLSYPDRQTIIVGSCDQNDRVTYSSNSGKGVTVFAPGNNIIVQTFSNASTTKNGLIFDPRNNEFFFENVNGTSFAVPQVVGVLACAFSYYHNNNLVEPISGLSDFVYSGHIIARSLLTTPYPSPYTSSLPVNIVSSGGRCYIPEILCCQSETWEESDANLQYSIWNDIHNQNEVYVGYPFGGAISSLRGGPNRILFNPHIKFLDILPSPNP